jgi:isopenicillin-N epimerase
MTLPGFDWREFHPLWSLRSDTIYLNHGSFGPPPLAVRQARARWQAALDEQPMDFFVRQYEPAWLEVRDRLARFVGANPANLIFVANATVGMNVVADSFALEPGDEVLLTDHEYGAVRRIWSRACERAQAIVREVVLPSHIDRQEAVVETIAAAVSPRTRLLVASHITSPTAVTLPIGAIGRRMRALGVAVCVDGPHAVAELPLELESLDCDFYTASCHKWLSAPFGSGFLWVAPKHQQRVRPHVLSWGRLLPSRPECWSDEFIWSGTSDPSAWLAVPDAIESLEAIGLDRFRNQTHALARYARERLAELGGDRPIAADSNEWYTSMAHMPLPRGSHERLQARLWHEHQIEVPIVSWNDRWFIRVSCHLYNDPSHIDRLIGALRQELSSGSG